MVHDYWMHRDAPSTCAASCRASACVLAWFERRIDETGTARSDPVVAIRGLGAGSGPGNPSGRRRGALDGHHAAVRLCPERAGELEAALGLPARPTITGASRRRCATPCAARAWDAARGLFRDTPEGSTYSQQTNVMAVLIDAVAPADQAALMERVLSDATLTQSTYYFSYYQLEALRKAGLGERYIGQLAPWRGMLDLGLTTVPETPEPTRSDSHAWSAHPNYGLLATVLGVRPAAPGFKKVRIAPQLGPLQRAEGRVPHPLGRIEVRLARTAGGGLRAEVTLPDGVEGVLAWGGKEAALRPGRQALSF